MSRENRYLGRDASPERRVRANWSEFVLLGGFLVVLGVLAVVVPVGFGTYEQAFLGHLVGWLLLGAGVGHLVVTARGRAWQAFRVFNLVVGVFYLLLGIVFLLDPTVAIGQFRTVLIGFFLFHGIAFVSFGFRLRDAPYWYTVVASGVVSILLGVSALFRLFPPWPIGEFLLGVSLIVVGLSLLVVARGARPSRRVEMIDPWG